MQNQKFSWKHIVNYTKIREEQKLLFLILDTYDSQVLAYFQNGRFYSLPNYWGGRDGT